jgi:hypothetical protein
MAKNGTVAYVSTIPKCDICYYSQERKITPSAYDGKTIHGPWANMCALHFSDVGTGLGIGRGQRLILADDVK